MPITVLVVFTAVVTVVVANPAVNEDVVDEDVRDKDEIHFISISSCHQPSPQENMAF